MNRIALIALALPLALACDDDTSATPMVTYNGALSNGLNSAPIAEASICFVSHPDIACIQTKADGTYTIDLPASEDVEVEVTKDGFISVRSNFITRKNNTEISAQMFPPLAVETAFQLAGVAYDDTQGGLLVRVYDPARGQTVGLAGVKVEVEPSDGDGPFYVDGLTFNTTAEATTPNGNALFSSLGDQTYKITLTSATHTCKGTYLWKAPGGGFEAVVKPGFVTYIYADCAPNP